LEARSAFAPKHAMLVGGLVVVVGIVARDVDVDVERGRCGDQQREEASSEEHEGDPARDAQPTAPPFHASRLPRLKNEANGHEGDQGGHQPLVGGA
jgi:hypothetical protein